MSWPRLLVIHSGVPDSSAASRKSAGMVWSLVTISAIGRFAVIRSMTHGEAAHERGTHNMFTGYKPSPALLYPSFGSVISHEYGPRNNLPPYVCIPNMPNDFLF